MSHLFCKRRGHADKSPIKMNPVFIILILPASLTESFGFLKQLVSLMKNNNEAEISPPPSDELWLALI